MQPELSNRSCGSLFVRTCRISCLPEVKDRREAREGRTEIGLM